MLNYLLLLCFFILPPSSFLSTLILSKNHTQPIILYTNNPMYYSVRFLSLLVVLFVWFILSLFGGMLQDKALFFLFFFFLFLAFFFLFYQNFGIFSILFFFQNNNNKDRPKPNHQTNTTIPSLQFFPPVFPSSFSTFPFAAKNPKGGNETFLGDHSKIMHAKT